MERDGGGTIEIHATDVEPAFLAQAKAADVPIDVKAMVRFLPPANFITYEAPELYEAVVCMNALCYISPDGQRRAIERMSGYARRFLCVSAASPSIIKMAMEGARFAPVARNFWSIYYGHGMRTLWPRKDWKRPYIPMLRRDWRYSGCSIFGRIG